MGTAFIENGSCSNVTEGIEGWNSRDGFTIKGNVRSCSGFGSSPELVDDCSGVGITNDQFKELLHIAPIEFLEAEIASRQKKDK